MKRNKTAIREAHEKKRGRRSRYAEKVARGQQVYGDGKRCCAHRIKLEYWNG